MQPNFEIIELEQPLPPALQLAQDAVAQSRASHQWQQTRQQQLEDAAFPNLTYAGQSQGQTLLRTPEGNLFRAGVRDSNGALLPGVADIVSSSGVVRVGGMPRVQPVEQPTSGGTVGIAVLISRVLASDEISQEIFLKQDSFMLLNCGLFERPTEVGDVLGLTAASYYDRDTIILQAGLVYASLGIGDEISNTALVIQNRAVVLQGESNIVVGTSEPFEYPDSLNPYLQLLRVAQGILPPVYEPYTDININSQNASVLADGSAVIVFGGGDANASSDSYFPGFRTLLNGVYLGCARGFENSYNSRRFPARRAVKLTEADLAVWELTLDSMIRPNSLAAPLQTIASFRDEAGADFSQFYDEAGNRYFVNFVRGYTDAT